MKTAVDSCLKPVRFLFAEMCRRFTASSVLLVLLGTLIATAPVLAAQRGAAPVATPAPGPTEVLQELLTAACRHDEAAFANHLGVGNAEAYRALPDDQRVALLRRLVLRDDSGKPLLSASDGQPVIRCEAGGVTSEIRFGPPEIRENLAFIPVSVPEGEETQSVRFGLVKESGQWKLISVGLLLLDIPALARQWEEEDLQAREREAIEGLHKIASALKSYQRAYGKLPESLELLGPAPADGASPEAAGLLNTELAKGQASGYRVRYTIVPVNSEGDESDRDKAAGFTLAATPVQYGKNGRRSFLLDSGGMLRGEDKHGDLATAEDPALDPEDSQVRR